MTAPAHQAIRSPLARELQGSRAGFISRLAADGIDALIVISVDFGILFFFGLMRFLIERGDFQLPTPPLWYTTISLWTIAVIYLTSGWGTTGRTVGKSIIGLRVLNADGAPLSWKRAFSRALVCCTIGWILLFWILVSRRSAGFHDVMLHTAVVYDWQTDV